MGWNETKKVTVVIPCFNEEGGVASVINAFPVKQLTDHNYTLEILVVDNNSTDNTTAVAEANGARVIHEPKKGKGNAIRTGFANVSPDTDYVVMLDGDDTYRPEEVLRMLEPLRSGFCNVVIGSRLGGKISDGSMKTFNRIGNWVYSHLVRYVYRVNVTDVLTGYFAWKREVIEKLHPHLESQGFAIEMEMITKMARMGEEIYSVPISYHARAGESSLSPVRDGLRILWMFTKNLLWQPGSKKVQRIAFVTDVVFPYHNGGKERRLYEIARRLVSDSHEVHIYTMKWWRGAGSTVVHEGVVYHALCRLYPLYTKGRRSMLEAIMFGLATFRMLFVRFDVLDVDHMPYFPLFSARIVTWLRGKKLHATWHEVCGREVWNRYLGGVSGHIAFLIERMSFLLPDVIISNSNHTTGRLREIGVKKTIETVPLGVDVAYIRSIEPSEHTSDVIFVGRFLSHKHADVLIRAIALVQKTRSNITCTIVGDGPEKEALHKLVTELKLEGNVTILGTVEGDAHLYGLMKASKILVLPSTQEGFGLVILEANAAGLPAITTPHKDNAAKDLIQEGVNGVLAEPEERDLADKIIHILNNRETMDPTRDIEQYDWGYVVKNLRQVLV